MALAWTLADTLSANATRGAFVAGSSHGPWDLYDGTHVAVRGDCVVVSANYRLDAFGWLVTSKEAGGNFGLQDQQLALAWVRDNIAAFGGDPGRVTLWGESAGGMSGAKRHNASFWMGEMAHLIATHTHAYLHWQAWCTWPAP